MNVLFVQPALPLYRVPFFSRLARNEGWSVTVWSDHRSALHAHGAQFTFTAEHHPERHHAGFVFQPAVWQAVCTEWATVVVLTWNTHYVHLLPALLEARRRHKPVVLWGHGYSKSERAVLRFWRNRLGALADVCVTYSHATRRRLLSEGFAPERVVCAPNALHDGPLARTHSLEETAGMRERLRTRGIHGPYTILFVSRVEADKRPHLLVEAFALVRQEVPDAELVVVGKGSELDALQRRVKAMHLDDAVTFIGALYDEAELAPLFLGSTVFAYPAAIGLSLLHAFSYGLPVVTSDAIERHNPEIEVFSPDVNGLAYEDGNVRDFARQLVRVLTDDELRERLSRGALESVTPPNGRTMEAMAQGMTCALEHAARHVHTSR